MRYLAIFLLLTLQTSALAAAKPHGVCLRENGLRSNGSLDAKKLSCLISVRPLIGDGHAKEFVTGPSHDITEHLFAVRRAFRVNDS
jgi:hypothetical protein